MKAKIAKRLLKLRVPLTPSVSQSVVSSLLTADQMLQSAWSKIQKNEAVSGMDDLPSISLLDFRADTVHQLPLLDKFIGSLQCRLTNNSARVHQPVCPLGSTEATDTPYDGFSVCRMEQRRVSTSDNPESTLCRPSSIAIKAYYKATMATEQWNPESRSLMVLGVLEIWVVCDKAAVAACPLLGEYDPGLPTEMGTLLLPFKHQMERLSKVEEYIKARKAAVRFKSVVAPGMFGNANSFPVRYYDQSPDHQRLLQQIEDKASDDQEKKIIEFDASTQRRQELVADSEALDHECTKRRGKKNKKKRKACKACSLRREADALDIMIHEWPLPHDELHKKSVVFELLVPQWFGYWREATLFVLFDVLCHSYGNMLTPGGLRCHLRTDIHLSGFFQSYSPSRLDLPLGLLSEKTAHTGHHRQKKLLSQLSSVEDLLLQNGLEYGYFDTGRDCFVADTVPPAEQEAHLSYELPKGSRLMQKFLSRPLSRPDGPSPNTVMASQSECPGHLSPAEYKALASMPLGHRIQWLNILLQVTSPAVDFKMVETSMTVLQCIYQTGPSGTSWVRSSHAMVSDVGSDLGERMLQRLHEATGRIENNWKGTLELGTYVSIARRVLSLSNSDTVKHASLSYLERARHISFRWSESLQEKARAVTGSNEGQRIAFCTKATLAALVCADTFNFEDTFSGGEDVLSHALSKRDSTVVFILSSIFIQENKNLATEPLIKILLARWKRIC
ncbi:hypothetical protein IMZ48_46200, partial [Candidatus Bathyarchaeota archaeon]|nr:hypothetical protein [Candidatus Bathyarchaeota archaeon]